MKRIVVIVGFLLFGFWTTNSLAAQEVKLDWSHKFTSHNSEGTFRFLKVWTVGDSLKFDILVHNTHKQNYACILISATESTLHMDDELGNEYKGASVMFNNSLDNKLAINQRKRFVISISKPSDEVDVANIHFGFHLQYIANNGKCPDHLGNHLMNFHKSDWDVGQFRN